MEDLFFIMRIHYEDGRRCIMITEPGIIGKVGSAKTKVTRLSKLVLDRDE